MTPSARYTIDLHAHSTRSDGALTPTDLVERAASCGVRTLALTDHDTVEGLDEARNAGATWGVELVAGVEISAWLGREVHVLGYFIDDRAPGLSAVLDRQRNSRVQRVRDIGARLERLGLPIDADAVIASADGNVGRPHIARALVAAGHVPDTQAAFDRLLGGNGSAYVPASRLTAEYAVRIIHDAGGVAVLAHPGVEAVDDRIPGLVDAGLDGIEVEHPAHDAATANRYRGLAHRLGLVPTGGSDFHHPGGHPLGAYGVDEAALSALAARRPAAP